jgi:hypothetical protein
MNVLIVHASKEQSIPQQPVPTRARATAGDEMNKIPVVAATKGSRARRGPVFIWIKYLLPIEFHVRHLKIRKYDDYY